MEFSFGHCFGDNCLITDNIYEFICRIGGGCIGLKFKGEMGTVAKLRSHQHIDGIRLDETEL